VTGTGATIDSAFSGSKYAGYTSGGETIATRSGSTGASADTISIANRVAINYASATGVYSDTVTYTVTPNYS
jgi:spore coat protein U-like protein